MTLRNGPMLFVACVVGTVWYCTAMADVPKPEAEIIAFSELNERTRKADETGEWRQAQWKDEMLQQAIDKLIASVKAATGRDQVALPVELSQVTAGRNPRAAGPGGGALVVSGSNVSVPFASKSIFLVDGSIRISHASDCIVIARGVVEIGHGNRNVIVAGHHVDVSFDGMDALGPRPGAIGDPPLRHCSVIVSGGSISIAHANGTACSAPGVVDISHAKQVAFLRTPKVDISHQQGCTEHKDFICPIAIDPPRPLPEEVLTVKQIVAPDDRTKQLVTVERNGIEYVLRPGGKLVDEKGEPIEEWSDWTVGFVAEDIVLFTDGKRDLSVRLP